MSYRRQWLRFIAVWAAVFLLGVPFMMYEILMWAGWIGFALWGMRINAGPPGTH